MQHYSISTLRNKAKEAGYLFSEGYQHYLLPGHSFFRDISGNRHIGYEIIDRMTGGYCHRVEIIDHPLDYDEAVARLKELCAVEGVYF